MKKPKLMVVFACIIIFSGLMTIINFMIKNPPSIKGTSMTWYTPIIGMIYVISGIGILKLKSWARWIILIISAYFLIKTPTSAFLWFQRFGFQVSSDKVASIALYASISVVTHLLILYFFGIRWKEFFKKQ